jgi:hypothetical protein
MSQELPNPSYGAGDRSRSTAGDDRSSDDANLSLPLQFFEPRDLLQVIYQTSTVLQLQQGFPSATSYLGFRWSELKATVATKGVVSAGLMGVLAVIGAALKLLRPVFQSSRNPADDASFWMMLVGTALLALLITLLMLGQVLIRQSWKFDRGAGELSWNAKTLFLGSRQKTYVLAKFQNIELRDVESSSLFNQQSLELVKVMKPGKKGKLKYRVLSGVGFSSAPDFSSRLQFATALQRTIQQFMGWPVS